MDLPNLASLACRIVDDLSGLRGPDTPREIALARLSRAEALGLGEREYALEIMQRGRYP